MELIIPRINRAQPSREALLAEFIAKRGMYDRYKKSTELLKKARKAIDDFNLQGNRQILSTIYQTYCDLFTNECVDQDNKYLPYTNTNCWGMHEDFFTLAKYVYYIRDLTALASFIEPLDRAYQNDYEGTLPFSVNQALHRVIERPTKVHMAYLVGMSWKHAKACHQILASFDKQIIAQHH